MFGKCNGFVSKARVSACMYFLVQIPYSLRTISDLEYWQYPKNGGVRKAIIVLSLLALSESHTYICYAACFL